MAIATDDCNVTGRQNFLAQKLVVKIVGRRMVRTVMRTASLWPVAILPEICTVAYAENFHGGVSFSDIG